MEPKKCKVKGCQRSAVARGLCSTHYNYDLVKRSPTCSIPGCERKSVAKGLCELHYRRFRVHGDPTKVVEKKEPRKPASKIKPQCDYCFVEVYDLNSNVAKFAKIDNEDVHLLKGIRLHCQKNTQPNREKNDEYSTPRSSKNIPLSHLIMGKPGKGRYIHNKNKDTYDCRKENLIVGTKSDYLGSNRKRNNCTSKYKGVSYYSRYNKYIGRIQKDGIIHHLGYFTGEEEAAKAYNDAAKKMFGQFARINLI